MSPAETTLASGGSGGVVQLWRLSSGKEAHEIRDHSVSADASLGAAANSPAAASVTALAVVPPAGTMLITASDDRSIRFWQLSDGKYLGSADDPAMPLHTVVSFSC